MENELVPITFNKVMQTRSYTVVILGTEEKRFAIYTDPNIGRTIQMHLTDTERPRPLTHDLMNMVFQGLKVKVKQVVINDIQEISEKFKKGATGRVSLKGKLKI